MRNRIFLIDASLGLLFALVLVLVSPGVAVVAIVAVIVLLICAITFIVERMLQRRRRSARPRTRPRGSA